MIDDALRQRLTNVLGGTGGTAFNYHPNDWQRFLDVVIDVHGRAPTERPEEPEINRLLEELVPREDWAEQLKTVWRRGIELLDRSKGSINP